MQYKTIIRAAFLAAFVTISANAFSWGQKGHDVTCAIAQKHLSCKARRQVDRIFEGKSMVYWANWMDQASHTEAYRYTSTWHYRNVDADQTYENAPACETGDVLTAIESAVSALKSGKLNKEQEALNLRMLIHFVGDLHCPMHAGHKSDLGGNKTQVQFFGRGTNLHSVWDSAIVESAHKWTYSEWASEIDHVSNKEFREMTSGTPFEWGRDAYTYATRLYEATPIGSKLSYDYVSEWTPVVERQLLLGGLRLAAILNGIW